MRTVAVVTGSRADYCIYRPILTKLRQHPDLRLRLMVCGAHLSTAYGRTVDDIIADGYRTDDRIETLVGTDTPQAIAESVARGVEGFARAFARERPDILLLLGDRYEMLAAAMAAMPFAMPLAHIHGGEATEGVIDEAIRHSLTKMSHLHFVTTEIYAKRVVQLGEHPERVFVTGAPGLDNLRAMRLLTREELAQRLDMDMTAAPILVTYHPTTLEYEDTLRHFAEMLVCLDKLDQPLIFTFPNADTRGEVIMSGIREFVSQHARARAFPNLGTEVYFSLMAIAAAMVGNSSSGIIEASSFALPVVNIGDRQRGRIRGTNVIDCRPERADMGRALTIALDPRFRTGLSNMKNPYGDGHAAEAIVSVLASFPLNADTLKKRFFDLGDLA